MLKSLLQFFDDNSTENVSSHTVEVATAALLSEIIRADADVNDNELQAYKAQLCQQFALSDEALNSLMEEGQNTAEDAVDLVQFTQVINKMCSEQQKWEILVAMWSVAYADNTLAPIEEHAIRRIADLLHVPHQLFIKAKLQVSGKN